MLTRWFQERNAKLQQFVLLFLGGSFIYAELMIYQLTNDYDGLWEGSFHNAGNWELSIGRWFWQYISRLRFGTSVDPYTSLITLALLAAGLVVLFDLWQIRNLWIILLSGFLFISNSAVCFELSYRYMSPTFGVAFLLSVLSVWCFRKIPNLFAAVLAGSFCIAFSMGSYQAFICSTTVAFLTTSLIMLSRNINWKDILLFCGKSIAGIMLGGMEYIVILNLYLMKNNVKMSGYQGGNQYSILNSIRNLPKSISRIYQIFQFYFQGILFKVNRLQGKSVFTILFLVILLFTAFLFLKIWKKSRWKAVVFLGLLLLYPVAALSILMITTEAGLGLQMACGPALFLAALPCLFWDERSSLYQWPGREPGEAGGKLACENAEGGKRQGRILEKCRTLLNWGFLLFMAGVLYGSICQVVIDQNTMYEGRLSTENITDLAVEKLLQKDLISSQYRYVFVGTPVSCPLYTVGPNYVYANQYALYGAWYLGANSAKSWRGVVRGRRGLNLDMVVGTEYEMLSTSETVKNMACFPEQGSILLEDDIVYVKIGDA